MRPSPAIRRELLRFLLVGGIAVLIDYLVYLGLQHLGLGASWAKRWSFGVGSVWAFVMNKFYTFERRRLRAAEPFTFAVVYLLGWFLNSLCHDLVLQATGLRQLAFLVATGVSTCNNFIGQKWWVFRRRQREEPAL